MNRSNLIVKAGTPDAEAPLVTFRDTLERVLPPWLKGPVGLRIMFSLSVQLDAAGDALIAGIKIRFPNVYSAESLGLIGRERRIRRGLVELDATYAGRLVRWWEDHKRRGGPYALLAQLYHHYAPNAFPLLLAYRSGATFQMAPDGSVVRDTTRSPNVLEWSHWLLLYFTDTVTIADADDLKTIPREWIAAHCLGLLVLMPTGARLWGFPQGRFWGNPEPWGSPPDGGRIPVGG
jgi:hypothetical protein